MPNPNNPDSQTNLDDDYKKFQKECELTRRKADSALQAADRIMKLARQQPSNLNQQPQSTSKLFDTANAQGKGVQSRSDSKDTTFTKTPPIK